jgi:hypothetical protein
MPLVFLTFKNLVGMLQRNDFCFDLFVFKLFFNVFTSQYMIIIKILLFFIFQFLLLYQCFLIFFFFLLSLLKSFGFFVKFFVIFHMFQIVLVQSVNLFLKSLDNISSHTPVFMFFADLILKPLIIKHQVLFLYF